MGVTFSNITVGRSNVGSKICTDKSDYDNNEFAKIFNSVEIDWNGAKLSDANQNNEIQIINTTSQLLDLINTMQKDIYVLTAAVMSLISNPKKDYYWYIGTENSSSISNIQTDNTKPGWHKIGTSLNGFILDTNYNRISLSETNRIIYYIIIPNDLYVYNGLGQVVDSVDYTPQACNISGYKSLKLIPDPDFPDGVRYVQGPIIRQ